MFVCLFRLFLVGEGTYVFFKLIALCYAVCPLGALRTPRKH